MKRLFYIFVFCICLQIFPKVYSAYELSKKEEVIAQKYVQKAQNLILEKGKKHKDFMLYMLKEKQAELKENVGFFSIFQYIIDTLEQPEPPVWGKEFSDLHIDTQKVKTSWINWINEERNLLGIEKYSYNNNLEKTALEWSRLAKEKGVMDHKVHPEDSYYDYKKKATWMKEHGVICKNIYRVTFSESIGWGVFNCSDNDCTEELTNAIKGSFDFYMNEKGKEYKPHYEAIAGKLFTIMGLGIELEKTSNTSYKYYLTNHYCTQLVQ